MARWPGPTYNRLIVTDPQIVKVDGASAEVVGGFQWGSRQSLFSNHLNNDPKGANPGQPSAPEMTIRHTDKA